MTLRKFPRYGPTLTDSEKAQLLDELAEHLPILVNVQDLTKGQFSYVSGAWEDLSGVSVERWQSDPAAWVAMVHPEDREATIDMAEAGKGRAQSPSATRILHPDGTIHWVEGWLAPITDSEGNVVRVIGACVDVTRHKRLEECLRSTHLKLEQQLRAYDVETARLRAENQRLRDELGHADQEVAAATAAFETLTSREKDVFHRLTRGARNKEIAAELHIALGTVKVHRRRVLAKFGVDNLARLVAKAVRSGLVTATE